MGWLLSGLLLQLLLPLLLLLTTASRLLSLSRVMMTGELGGTNTVTLSVLFITQCLNLGAAGCLNPEEDTYLLCCARRRRLLRRLWAGGWVAPEVTVPS